MEMSANTSAIWSAVQVLRDLLQKAEASGISDRSYPEIMKAAREKARLKGLLE
jgi:antitoxin ParD1/3/4